MNGLANRRAALRIVSSLHELVVVIYLSVEGTDWSTLFNGRWRGVVKSGSILLQMAQFVPVEGQFDDAENDR